MLKYLALGAIAALTFTGCNRSPEGGATGSSNTSFSIGGPTLTTDIKQDNKKSVTLTLHRGSDFKKTVKLSALAPDNGKIKVDFNKDTIGPGDPSDVTMNIAVAKDATKGEQIIKVTGTPEGGGTPTTVDVKINVEQNQ